MVADIAFHDFTGGTVTTHAHILTTRNRQQQFSMKKNRSGTRGNLACMRHGRNTNRALEQAQSQTRIDHRSYKDRGHCQGANETQQEWHMAEANPPPRRVDVVNREIAAGAEQEHQHDQQLERLNAMMDIGRMLARDHITRNEQQSQKPQPERFDPRLGRNQTDRGLEPLEAVGSASTTSSGVATRRKRNRAQGHSTQGRLQGATQA